jgi:hypothetical protein
VKAFAPLVLLAWFVFWVANSMQPWCEPALNHHVAGLIEEHSHDHAAPLAHVSPAVPDPSCCHQLKSFDVVSSAAAVLSEDSQRVLQVILYSVMLLHVLRRTPNPFYLHSPQPPPRAYLRTRRLLI